MFELLDLTALTLIILFVCTFVTAILHGATGMAGGIVLTAILSHLIGIKQAIPLMTCALIFSHSSRVYFHLKNIEWRVVKTVLMFSTPTIILGALLFTQLQPSIIAAIMACFLILSFPIKAYADRNNLQTTPTFLAAASTVWGLLAGNVIGPGFLLAPFLMGTGMNRLTFVGSLAVIVLYMNITKLIVFGSADAVTAQLLVLGVLLGLITIPGNWLGRALLKRLSDRSHRSIVDWMTVLMILNFIYLFFVSRSIIL